MPRTIPERNPIGDPFTGVVLQVNSAQVLAPAPVEGAAVEIEGTFIVRYGIRFLGKSHVSIVPGLVVMDYGDMLTGEDAWTFLLKRSNLHPRAEVVGYRNDGRDDMVFVRQLDLALPVEVLVYGDSSSATPVAKPRAMIRGKAYEIAPRIEEYLPVYDTLAAWEQEQKNE